MKRLNGLSKMQLSRFEEFVNSPYHNKFKTLSKLFNYLNKFYPDINEEHISKHQVSLNIYNEIKINDVKIRKLKQMNL